MTNTLMLKTAIVERGFTIKDIAAKMELSPCGFHNKLHNRRDFKAGEISRLADLLMLDDRKRDQIFFA